MKEIKIKVPENKLDFLIELIRQLGFEVSSTEDVSDSQKTIVKDRITNSKPGELLDWDDVKGNFKLD